MEPVEYVFRIDVFTPDTIPMERLAKYLAALAKMFGHPEHTHFAGISNGSALLKTKVDFIDAPKTEARLQGVRLGDAPRDALAAKEELESLLANDNAVGELRDGNGATVIPFIGRDRPRPLVLPPFKEDTSIEGQLVNIGGKDSTAHATLQDGDIFHTGITMRRDMAKELASLLYGPVLRLFGNGRFERLASGEWKMTDFKTSHFETLIDRPITSVLADIRAIPGNALMLPGARDQLDSETFGRDRP